MGDDLTVLIMKEFGEFSRKNGRCEPSLVRVRQRRRRARVNEMIVIASIF